MSCLAEVSHLLSVSALVEVLLLFTEGHWLHHPPLPRIFYSRSVFSLYPRFARYCEWPHRKCSAKIKSLRGCSSTFNTWILLQKIKKNYKTSSGVSRDPIACDRNISKTWQSSDRSCLRCGVWLVAFFHLGWEKGLMKAQCVVQWSDQSCYRLGA